MAVDPVIAGAGIQAGGSLIGGLLGAKSSGKEANKAYRRAKEFAQHKYYWAAKDAKAAGLHPLFALGAGSGGGSPTFMAGQSPMGSAVADAAAAIGQGVAAKPTEVQRNLAHAQIESINSQTRRNDAEAALANSQARRVAQESYARGNDILQTAVSETAPVPVGKVRHVPAKITSHATGDRSTTAGTRPFFSKYNTRDGYYMYAPASEEPAEALESVLGAALGVAKTSFEGVPYWTKKAIAETLGLVRGPRKIGLKQKRARKRAQGRNRR